MTGRTTMLSVAMVALWTTAALPSENSQHTMTGGSFGVAWIDPGETVHWSDGRSAPKLLLPDFKAYKLIAADLDGDQKDELALLDTGRKSLFIFDFEENSLAGGYGHNVADFSAGVCSPDEAFESIFACTFSGATYRWTVEVGNEHWHELPGDFENAAAGQLDTRNRVVEFATVSRGDVFVFNPQWKAYSQLMMGRGAKAVATGDLSAYPGDEVVVACGEKGNVVLCMRRKAEALGKKAVCLAVGKPGEGRDKLLVITPQGTIECYDRDEKVWTTLSEAASWGNLILCDTDGDNVDELYAIKKDQPESLYRLSAGNKAFEPVK